MYGGLELMDLTDPKSQSLTESSEIRTFSLVIVIRFDVPVEQAVGVHMIKAN